MLATNVGYVFISDHDLCHLDWSGELFLLQRSATTELDALDDSQRSRIGHIVANRGDVTTRWISDSQLDRSLVILDQAQNRAVVSTHRALFSSLTPAGFKQSENTAVFTDPNRIKGAAIIWDESADHPQFLQSGWLSARQLNTQFVRQIQTSQRRLVVQKKAPHTRSRINSGRIFNSSSSSIKISAWANVRHWPIKINSR